MKKWCVLLGVSFLPSLSFAAFDVPFLAVPDAGVSDPTSIPHCLSSSGNELDIDNTGMIEMESANNQPKTEAHVKGSIIAIYANQTGHQHFAIRLDPPAPDSSPAPESSKDAAPIHGIEVVYNTVFGALPALTQGMQVEACGEFISAKVQSGPYPPSPMGAIIHWVHINPNQGRDAHPSGFLVVDGKVCGQDASHADHGHHGGAN